jgi:Mitochondrial domain of unknown function (DUF1713)
MPGSAEDDTGAEVCCGAGLCPAARCGERAQGHAGQTSIKGGFVGSVIKKRRKRMAKKKHRKLLRKTRVQRRNKK